jgi:hypothetical protein
MVVVALPVGQTVVAAVVKAKGRVVVEMVVGDQGKVGGGGSLRGRMPVAKVVHPPKGAKQRLDVWRVGTGLRTVVNAVTHAVRFTLNTENPVTVVWRLPHQLTPLVMTRQR